MIGTRGEPVTDAGEYTVDMFVRDASKLLADNGLTSEHYDEGDGPSRLLVWRAPNYGNAISFALTPDVITKTRVDQLVAKAIADLP